MCDITVNGSKVVSELKLLGVGGWFINPFWNPGLATLTHILGVSTAKSYGKEFQSHMEADQNPAFSEDGVWLTGIAMPFLNYFIFYVQI